MVSGAQSVPSPYSSLVPSHSSRDTGQPWGPELPLVGRRDEVQALQQHLTRAIAGHGHCVLVTGDAGVGKSRLLQALGAEAAARGVLVAAGSAYAVESGVPYGAFANPLAPALRRLDPSVITLLARGADRDLRAVIPGLPGTAQPTVHDGESDASSRSRLLWNVSQFITRLAARQPLLLILDNAHESDASSIALLHFLARQIAEARVLIVVAYLESETTGQHALADAARSLLAARQATALPVQSLSRADLADLLRQSFALDADSAAHHAAGLWSHTRGNPFFVDESLKALIAAGRIRPSGDTWLIEDPLPATLPPTVRDAVLARLATLDDDARKVTDVVAAMDARAPLAVIARVTALDPTPLADAIDTLCRNRTLTEHRTETGAGYEFSHPIIHAAVRSTLTAARERVLHSGIAAALEAVHGDAAIDHAADMARHLVRGESTGDDPRTLRYLAAAGRDALARRADHEAMQWLRDAVRIADRLGDSDTSDALLEELATACLRTGDTDGAEAHWRRALARAETRGDALTRTRLLLQLAQRAARTGDATAGLQLLADAEATALSVARTDLVIRIGISRAKLQQALGQREAATATVHSTLERATALGDDALLSRAHQTALQLYAWTGPAAVAREHGAQAIALADRCGNRTVAWSAHWAMAMLEGFTGDGAGVARHLTSAATLADELASPVLQALTAEIEIEHASGVGRWNEALAIAERTIPLARAVLPQSLLSRLLVWTGLILLARDETERARTLLEEAWALSGSDRSAAPDAGEHPLGNVHNVILAHTGMGTFHLSHGDWVRALEYGEAGLAIADRYGYVAWAIHRLIPMMIEAALRLAQYDRAEALTARLREHSVPLGHRLGLAWATAADALIARMRHQSPDTAARLLAAADELDAVPFVFHAARMRRNAAQVLEADGETAAAVRELRRAHTVFLTLGAEFELRGVRNQLRGLGVRLPPRHATTGAGALSGRELEIAQLVAQHLSNKEIGAELGISARTVSTHLSNIFAKLGVESRGELSDAVRELTQNA